MRFQWIRPRVSEYAPSDFFPLTFVFCRRAADKFDTRIPASTIKMLNADLYWS
jgi:hypothetical protein